MRFDVHTAESVLPFAPVPLWQFPHDYELYGYGRTAVGDWGSHATPEVVRLLSEVMKITEQWQYYLIAINILMERSHQSAIMNGGKYLANGQGVDAPWNRANFIMRENLTAELPKFSAVYSCGGAVVTGVPQGSELLIKMMDGNNPPALKEGRRYPTQISEINPADYKYLPQTHPWMFFAAVDVYPSGNAIALAHGAKYSWTPDPNRLHTFIPHVSRFPVPYPLYKLKKLQLGTPVPSPYLVVVK